MYTYQADAHMPPWAIEHEFDGCYNDFTRLIVTVYSEEIVNSLNRHTFTITGFSSGELAARCAEVMRDWGVTVSDADMGQLEYVFRHYYKRSRRFNGKRAR